MKDWAKDLNNFVLPMNAKTAEPEKIEKYLTDGWIVEQKHDGMRCSLYFGHRLFVPTKSHRVKSRAFSRSLGVADNLPVEITGKIPHITDVLYGGVNGTILDCELTHHLGFGVSREILGSNTNRALAMQFGKKLKMSPTNTLSADAKKLLGKMERSRYEANKPAAKNVVFYTDENGKHQIAPWYGPVKAMVFDLPHHCGSDLTTNGHSYILLQRLDLLDDLFEDYFDAEDGHLSYFPMHKADRYGDSMHRDILAQGGEGTMLKNLNGLYVPSTWNEEKNRMNDSRSSDWRKRKKQATFDVVIMGYEPANETSVKVGAKDATITKFHAMGWIGAVIFGVYDDGELIEVGRCSGMTEEVRKMLSNNTLGNLNRVIEVECHALNRNTHALSHPRFSGFRDDKRAIDCTLENHIESGKGSVRK